MGTGRLEAFSDGVLAIIITIMVLELRPPEGTTLGALRSLAPVFESYALSFVYVGMYWNNHHHLLRAAPEVDGAVMWANLHLLFWLSLFPFGTAWMGEHHFAAATTATYSFVSMMAALAYFVLQLAIVRAGGEQAAEIRAALGRDWKGKASVLIFLASMPLAFVSRWIPVAGFVVVAVMWFVPDRRLRQSGTT